jgi:hypothetical protein
MCRASQWVGNNDVLTTVTAALATFGYHNSNNYDDNNGAFDATQR